MGRQLLQAISKNGKFIHVVDSLRGAIRVGGHCQEQIRDFARQEPAAAGILSPFIGDQPPGNLTYPGAEIATRTELGNFLPGQEKRVLGKIIDRFCPNSQGANRRAQARLVLLHLCDEPRPVTRV